MWWLIIGWVLAIAAISIVVSRRGSTGASRADDLPSTYRHGAQRGGMASGGGYMGDGGDGGGGGD